MILVSHPTGNTFVRALLEALQTAGELSSYQTTVTVQESNGLLRWLPQTLQKELLRRACNLPETRVSPHPMLELVRLMAGRLGAARLTAHETGWASVDAVYNNLDRHVARQLGHHDIDAVYCYEDGALHTFRTAKRLALRCCYDLPIAYWQTSRQLLEEEAVRLPAWEPTLLGTRDSQAKLERKTEELELADMVVCPSRFVYNSLPERVRQTKCCVVAEFGSPEIALQKRSPRPGGTPMRVLFAGSMTQRKGLADLFAAIRLVARPDIELVVMGSPVAPMEFYRSQSTFTWEPTRPHRAVLELMHSCDVLVLPSIVEGRALVQQEAMMCGLPLIATANAGGDDLIDEGKTGFLVPIRSPEQIAHRLDWLADHRDHLEWMRALVRQKAERLSWQNYSRKILDAICPGLTRQEQP
ncbi:MAG: glycosyltransferase family 4 protein [Gemmatimonadaceae bacterium]|nr:glycosyltransferase family 4 protein [Gloeobacterales cyanobacterium ES-bin-141]